MLPPVLKEPWGTNGPMWWPGNRVNQALGLGGPKTPAHQQQAPWDGPLLGRPMVKANSQEAHRAEQKAVL